jgi:hypothetical protein
MNEPQAIKVEEEIKAVACRHSGVWMTVSKEMRPELKMLKIEISIKVDEKIETITPDAINTY